MCMHGLLIGFHCCYSGPVCLLQLAHLLCLCWLFDFWCLSGGKWDLALLSWGALDCCQQGFLHKAMKWTVPLQLQYSLQYSEQLCDTYEIKEISAILSYFMQLGQYDLFNTFWDIAQAGYIPGRQHK